MNKLPEFKNGIDIRCRNFEKPTVARLWLGHELRYIVIGTAYGFLHTCMGSVKTWRLYSGARRAAKNYISFWGHLTPVRRRQHQRRLRRHDFLHIKQRWRNCAMVFPKPHWPRCMHRGGLFFRRLSNRFFRCRFSQQIKSESETPDCYYLARWFNIAPFLFAKTLTQFYFNLNNHSICWLT